jgi:heptosyltransferase-3
MGASIPKNPMNLINPGSNNILIVRTDRLGDVVLTLPMARAIKTAVPNARVTFLASKYTQPIIERCPDVDEVRTNDLTASFWKMIRQFRGFDVAFFPSPRFPLALAAFLARVPKRIGTGYRWYSFLFTDKIYEHRKTAERHEAEYNLRMLASMPIVADAGQLPNIKLQSPETQFVERWIVEQLGGANATFAVLHITSGGSTQPWPVQKFIEVGRTIAEQPGMSIVLTGIDADAAVIQAAANSIGADHAIPFVGHTILELAALLERARIVITVGTGPGHLAAALGTPTVGIFPLPRPISKERWGFRGARVANISPKPISDCPNCKDCTCMERIGTEDVMNAIKTLFAL